MPFCPQCGVDNPAGARYCDQCGAMLVPVPAAQAQPVRTPPPAPAPVAPVASSRAPLINSSPVCPQCGTPAIPGEAFCDNCGAALSAPSASAPRTPPGMQVPPQTSFPPPVSSTPSPSSPPVGRLTPPTPVTTPAPPLPQAPPVTQAPPTGYGTRSVLAPGKLNAAATGQSILLPSAAQVTIGRADPVSQFFPDLDLTPYGAIDHGVGRRHARLFVNAGQVMIEDLESTNGTFVNGQRLAPRQPQILRNADQVMFGNLVLQYQE